MHSPTLEESIAFCKQRIRKGSKSFSLASRLFAKENREGAWLLYGWCRHCDDTIDEASHLPVSEVLTRLEDLKRQTELAYSDARLTDPVFIAMQHVVRTYSIPRHYPLELLEGMAMDIRKERYDDIADLSLYCYRVAGVVGLMMSHVMGISDACALEYASDMGNAMQLTNIARDVYDDARMGRVYLPLKWLEEVGLDPYGSPDALVAKILDPQNRGALLRVVARLLSWAESFYQSGDRGLTYLAYRPSCAVSAARQVYSGIGIEILRRGEEALTKRTWLSLFKKLILTARGVAKASTGRSGNRWRSIPINQIWRHRWQRQ